MLKVEFEEMTGVYVSDEEYAIIESDYYDSDLLKQDYCKKFIEDKEPERLYKERLDEIELLRGVALHLNEQVDDLKGKLETEEEWKTVDVMGQDEYEQLRNDSNVVVFSDEKAKEFISKELGFDKYRIQIIRNVGLWERNRHHLLRKTSDELREPLYSASDWFYICFEICGQIYEFKNGTLFDYVGF